MALNPPLTQFGDPCRVEGEYFVMKRKNVEVEFKVKNGNKYTGKGDAILTTCRIVFVNKDVKSLFKSFDLPLALTSKEKLEQPIFGANYLYGICQPLLNMLPGETTFKIWFMEGSFYTFVTSYLGMVANVRRNRGIDSKTLNSIQSGTYAKTAYIDPNDPSVIYLEQPEVFILY
jgi:hypothetical protein